MKKTEKAAFVVTKKTTGAHLQARPVIRRNVIHLENIDVEAKSRSLLTPNKNN